MGKLFRTVPSRVGLHDLVSSIQVHFVAGYWHSLVKIRGEWQVAHRICRGCSLAGAAGASGLLLTRRPT